MSSKTITLPTSAEFPEFGRGKRLTPERVLTQFMLDLSETTQSFGSDERMRAASWFDRVIWLESEDQNIEA